MTEIRDEWEHYPCQVDGGPAAVFLNLGYAEHMPVEDAPTLLWIRLQILEPGAHKIGMDPDVRRLYAIEDVIVAQAESKGLRYVGRLRHNGDWQLTFYGEPEHEAMLVDLVDGGLSGPEREYRTGTQDDPDWGYFRDFLMPGTERFQWIMDRRAVDQLRERGDVLTEARPVDHHLEFPEGTNIAPFLQAVQAEGFMVVERTTPHEDGLVPLHLRRNDALDRLQIHGVVMKLITLATPLAGEYYGWDCPVVTEAN